MLYIQDLSQALTLAEREPVQNFSEEVLEKAFLSWISPELGSNDYPKYLKSYGWEKKDVKDRLLSSTPAVETSVAWVKHLNEMNHSSRDNWELSGPFRFGVQSLEDLPFNSFFVPFVSYVEKK